MTNINNAATELNTRIDELFAMVNHPVCLTEFVRACFNLDDNEFDALEDAMVICDDTGNEEAKVAIVSGLIG